MDEFGKNNLSPVAKVPGLSSSNSNIRLIAGQRAAIDLYRGVKGDSIASNHPKPFESAVKSDQKHDNDCIVKNRTADQFIHHDLSRSMNFKNLVEQVETLAVDESDNHQFFLKLGRRQTIQPPKFDLNTKIEASDPADSESYKETSYIRKYESSHPLFSKFIEIKPMQVTQMPIDAFCPSSQSITVDEAYVINPYFKPRLDLISIENSVLYSTTETFSYVSPQQRLTPLVSMDQLTFAPRYDVPNEPPLYSSKPSYDDQEIAYLLSKYRDTPQASQPSLLTSNQATTKPNKLKFAKTDILKRVCAFNDTLDANTRKIGYIMKSVSEQSTASVGTPTRYSYLPSSTYTQPLYSTTTQLDGFNSSYSRQEYSLRQHEPQPAQTRQPYSQQTYQPYSAYSYSSRRPSQNAMISAYNQTPLSYSNLPYQYTDYRK